MKLETYTERSKEKPDEKCNDGSGAIKARSHPVNPEISEKKNRSKELAVPKEQHEIKTCANIIQDGAPFHVGSRFHSIGHVTLALESQG